MENLSTLIPPIKRARDFRLYDFRGRRFVDLYRAGGAALLGHKPHRLTTTLKQVLDKGLLANMPSVYHQRLIKKLGRLFPDYKTILVTASRETIFAWATDYAGHSLTIQEVVDPVLSPPGIRTDAVLSFWRPFSDVPPMTEALMPVLPFALGESPAVLCLKKAFTPQITAPPLSPLLLAGALHAIELLDHTKLPDWFSQSLFSASPSFTQQGLYLIPKCLPTAYAKLFHSFLEEGFLLSPFFYQPSILPLELSEGELTRLTTLLLTLKIGTAHG